MTGQSNQGDKKLTLGAGRLGASPTSPRPTDSSQPAGGHGHSSGPIGIHRVASVKHKAHTVVEVKKNRTLRINSGTLGGAAVGGQTTPTSPESGDTVNPMTAAHSGTIAPNQTNQASHTNFSTIAGAGGGGRAQPSAANIVNSQTANRPGLSQRLTGRTNEQKRNQTMVADNPLATLTDQERLTRLKVLEAAREAEEQRRLQQEAEALQQQAESERLAKEAAQNMAEDATKGTATNREDANNGDAIGTQQGVAKAAPPTGNQTAEPTDHQKSSQRLDSTMDKPHPQAGQAGADGLEKKPLGPIQVTVRQPLANIEKIKQGLPPELMPRLTIVQPAPDIPPSQTTHRRSGGTLGDGLGDLESDEEGRREERGKRVKTPSRSSKGDGKRREGKLTITRALVEEDEDSLERGRSLAALKRAREKERQRHKQQGRNEKVIREVIVPEQIMVGDLAQRMAERAGDVVKALMKMGMMTTINHVIDADTAELLVVDFGHRVKRVNEAAIEDVVLETPSQSEAETHPRAPVVTIMGHVDHGKTSLLDALRKSDVAAGEAGGITQHIGAYRVTLANGKSVTFLDTPGHEAFTSMRKRGANVTDIVVLVVAADDGVKPQTEEAISHAKAAGAPIIVAINKIDMPGADPAKVRSALLSHELVTEELGGDVLCVEVSAKQRKNLDKLVEAILLQAELMDLKAAPKGLARGAVVEAKQVVGRGSVATVLVQSGELKIGDIFVAGSEWGRVKALIDEHGKTVKIAHPADPVEVLGFQNTPQAGDEFIVLADESKARELVDYRQRRAREENHAGMGRSTLEQMFAQIKEGSIHELPVVIKADVQGSAEAIVDSLHKLVHDEVKVRILHSGVGAISESDVTLGATTGALVIGFNVRANPQAREQAKRDGVDIRYYSIIYKMLEEVESLMAGMLAPELSENMLGMAEIREIFAISKIGKVAGCMVTEGEIRRNGKIRILRDSKVIYDGSLKQLKRHKDDASSVRQGFECGMSFVNYDDLKQGDQIECYEIKETARSL